MKERAAGTKEDKALEVLDALYDAELEGMDLAPAELASSAEVTARASELLESQWDEYLTGLRTARAVHGAVPVQEGLQRSVVLARLAALQGRFPDRVVALGHRKLAEMTDGDLRSLLADVEELLASE